MCSKQYISLSLFLSVCETKKNNNDKTHDGKWLPSVLRSGKPERASVLFEKALDTVRGAMMTDADGVRRHKFPPLALARCLFHAGEARRQNREFHAASTFLEEAAAIVKTETSLGTHESHGAAYGLLHYCGRCGRAAAKADGCRRAPLLCKTAVSQAAFLPPVVIHGGGDK